MTQVREETREAWLNRAVEALREHVFEPVGEIVPPVRVSTGWPKGGRKVIGQCWKTTAADDEVSQVFISPVLKDMAEGREGGDTSTLSDPTIMEQIRTKGTRG